MSHFEDNGHDKYEQMFGETQKARVKTEAAEVEDELRSMKKRERYYIAILGGVILVAGIFGFHIFRGNSAENPFANSNAYSQVAYTPVSNTPGAGGGCGSASGGGSSSGSCCSSSTEAVDTAAIAQAGKAFYVEQTGTKDNVESKVTDYGCHIQCDIWSGGQVIKSYSYSNNTFVEI